MLAYRQLHFRYVPKEGKGFLVYMSGLLCMFVSYRLFEDFACLTETRDDLSESPRKSVLSY